jgi:hypothetical protein
LMRGYRASSRHGHRRLPNLRGFRYEAAFITATVSRPKRISIPISLAMPDGQAFGSDGDTELRGHGKTVECGPRFR